MDSPPRHYPWDVNSNLFEPQDKSNQHLRANMVSLR